MYSGANIQKKQEQASCLTPTFQRRLNEGLHLPFENRHSRTRQKYICRTPTHYKLSKPDKA